MQTELDLREHPQYQEVAAVGPEPRFRTIDRGEEASCLLNRMV